MVAVHAHDIMIFGGVSGKLLQKIYFLKITKQTCNLETGNDHKQPQTTSKWPQATKKGLQTTSKQPQATTNNHKPPANNHKRPQVPSKWAQ